jgi:hypothetical protein
MTLDDIKAYVDYIQDPLKRAKYLYNGTSAPSDEPSTKELEIVYSAVIAIRLSITDKLLKDSSYEIYVYKKDIVGYVKHLTTSLTPNQYNYIYYVSRRIFIDDLVKKNYIIKCSKFRKDHTDWFMKINKDSRLMEANE